jgi:tubulin polyglutamylase TTLL1
VERNIPLNRILNHLQNNSCLVSKKGLYLSLQLYCGSNQEVNLLDIIPRTYYLESGELLTEGQRSKNLADFIAFNDHGLPGQENRSDSCGPDKSPRDSVIWIVKPAARTNRGFGIQVVRGLEEVLNIVNRSANGNKSKADSSDINAECKLSKENTKVSRLARLAGAREGWIVQLYLDKPMLVSGRKFDVRCFVLVTHFKCRGLRAYYFNDAYVRTSSKKYSLVSLRDREAHLTNDAVQNRSKTYGLYEEGNKLSFSDWQETINRDYPDAPAGIVDGKFRPEIMNLCAITIAAAAENLQKTIINNSFELLGYDYMIDYQFKPTLIEINSNPCLEFVCPLLVDIISSLIENVVRVTLDTQLPPPPNDFRTPNCRLSVSEIEGQENKFTQIYPRSSSLT